MLSHQNREVKSKSVTISRKRVAAQRRQLCAIDKFILVRMLLTHLWPLRGIKTQK